MSDDRIAPGASTTPVSATTDLLHAARHSSRRVVLCVYHRDGVHTAALRPGAGVVVGREAPSDVIVQDGSLSRGHARFTLADGGVVVEDLGSLNGTRVDGRKVDRSIVKEGEAISLGAVIASIHTLAGVAAPSLGLSHDGFLTAVEGEVERARFFGRGFGILTVRCHDVERGHVRHWLPGVREALRPVDRVALYSADTVEILLPEVGPVKAEELARNITSPSKGGSALVCGLASFPETATTAEKLLAASREAALRATSSEPVMRSSGDPSKAWISLGSAAGGDERLTTKSPLMRAVIAAAKKVSGSTIPVLLLGETGTGKEVLSRFIHDSGPRSKKPMICVNCGSIPGQLVESALFGHERGAFTHAVQQQKGAFEAADGGTLLLDEIGELPAPAQIALLRVLESKRITRVGATKEIEVDVRVIAATHRDLEAMAEDGAFRLDLLYRLNAMTIEIPPLRERREDIEPLCRLFIDTFSKAAGREIRAVAPRALALLQGHGWPGNIRELRNVIERAVVIGEGDVLGVADLPERVRRGSAGADEQAAQGEARAPAPSPRIETRAPAPEASQVAERRSLKTLVESAERDAILGALREAGGNQVAAARLLDLPRRTLQHKIKTLGLKKLGYGTGTE
jgi:DNA-binding NtrC family response regulator